MKHRAKNRKYLIESDKKKSSVHLYYVEVSEDLKLRVLAETSFGTNLLIIKSPSLTPSISN